MAPRPDAAVQAILERLADLVEHAENLTYTAHAQKRG